MSRQTAAEFVVLDMGRLKPKTTFPIYIRVALVFLGCLFGIIAAYRHTNIKLFRAENGAYQRFAHESSEQQAQLIRTF